MRQIVFDLETTGFKFEDGHRIVEIGAVELLDGAVTGRTFHTYVNPERDMPDGAYRVHGLSAEFLSKFPAFRAASVGPAFCAFAGDAELIAHNGESFDLPFLNAELEAAGLPRLANRLLDTLFLARKRYPGAPASLDALCQKFGIDTRRRQRDGHGALLDSQLLASVYIELTGGAQAGFKLDEAVYSVDGQNSPRRARPRPTPLAPLLRPEEEAAHAAFIAELGPGALWTKHKGSGLPSA
ncbi:MAG: DNA polymerase III subunit epsilon [Parvularculaceae bacterium]|jgi:DNA polymerase-3 subunit epsilon|nr:DNA polymerase III subunit epsilon [Parvularculaceae bacterium]